MHLSNLFLQNMFREMCKTFKNFCKKVRLRVTPRALRPYAPRAFSN